MVIDHCCKMLVTPDLRQMPYSVYAGGETQSWLISSICTTEFCGKFSTYTSTQCSGFTLQWIIVLTLSHCRRRGSILTCFPVLHAIHSMELVVILLLVWVPTQMCISAFSDLPSHYYQYNTSSNSLPENLGEAITNSLLTSLGRKAYCSTNTE